MLPQKGPLKVRPYGSIVRIERVAYFDLNQVLCSVSKKKWPPLG